MEDSYELKMRAMLGDDFGDDKEITILNRLISWQGGVYIMKRTRSTYLKS